MYQTLSDFLVKTSGQELTVDNRVETLMLLHGWGMNSHVWEPIREALELRYHIIWIDLPGHGINRHLKAQNGQPYAGGEKRDVWGKTLHKGGEHKNKAHADQQFVREFAPVGQRRLGTGRETCTA